MASERQNEANRRNAQLSTGPCTADGRARVASNALKHGLTAKQVVLPGEDPAEFDEFRSDLIAGLAPQGALEEIFAEKIVADAWRFRRALQLVPALYQREEREAKLEAARSRKSSCETSSFQEMMESSMPTLRYAYVQIGAKPIRRPWQSCRSCTRNRSRRWFP